MSAPVYQSIQHAATEKNAVAINYAQTNGIALLAMLCMPLRYAMAEKLGVPCCNPDPITGERQKFPKDPLEQYDIYDLRDAIEDPAGAIKHLFHRKNTIGHKEAQATKLAQQLYPQDYEEDRIFKENTGPMEEDDDREINEFI